MKTTFSLLTGLLALALAPSAVAQQRATQPQLAKLEEKTESFDLTGKHVVVRVQGRNETYVLRDVSVRTIAGSAFLVGKQPDKSVDKETPLTMLRMDRIDEMVVFKSYDSLQDRYRLYGEGAKEKPSIEYEIRRVEALIGRLEPEILHHQEVLARLKVEVAQQEESLAKAGEKEKKAVEKRLDRDRARFSSMKNEVERLLADKARLEDQLAKLQAAKESQGTPNK